MFNRSRQTKGGQDPMPPLAELFQRWLRDGVRQRIAVNRKDGSILVYVPEGEFEMGDGSDVNCPQHRVHLSAYWMGVYCVTNAQYLKFVEATGYRVPDQADHREPPVWKGRSFPKEKASHPVVCVSWDDAAAYAKWAGCELPTEAQWEKAARGPAGLIYPWGNAWDAGQCRNYTNKGNETTSPVFGYPGGVSGYGTYNQAGNVWEWCADWFAAGYYWEPRELARDPLGPDVGSVNRVTRGGWWGRSEPPYFRGAYRGSGDPYYRFDSLGFRLVRTASPSLPS